MTPKTQQWRSEYYAYLRLCIIPFSDGTFGIGGDNREPWVVAEEEELPAALRSACARILSEHQNKMQPKAPPSIDLDQLELDFKELNL